MHPELMHHSHTTYILKNSPKLDLPPKLQEKVFRNFHSTPQAQNCILTPYMENSEWTDTQMK